jgi:hypothetical protein
MSGFENRLRMKRAPSEVPEGSDLVWGMISTLVAGPLAWGAIGYGVGALTGISALLPIGLVFGFLASLAYVLWSYQQSVATGAEKAPAPPAPPSAMPDDTPDRRGERP